MPLHQEDSNLIPSNINVASVATPTGIEPVPTDRQSVRLTVIVWRDLINGGLGEIRTLISLIKSQEV